MDRRKKINCMLEVENLTCGYNSKFVLEDISFKLNRKEILGIIGPNGCGKTTLLRAITKVLKPQKGRILLEGKDIQKVNFRELAKKVAVVSGTYNIDINVKTEEIVLLGRIPHRHGLQFFETQHDEDIAIKAMTLTDTIKFKERFIENLSAGERQLVFIACAMAQEPSLLLLDEPTSHLDIAHQVQILDLIKRLNRDNGLSVILVLHDLNLASEYCDRLILLNSGKIFKIGIPQEVLTYGVIEAVYNTIVIVQENPFSKKPYILIVSEVERKKGDNR